MGLAIATTFALALWIVLWAVGVKSFDAFLLTVLIVLLATTARMLAQYRPGERE